MINIGLGNVNQLNLIKMNQRSNNLQNLEKPGIILKLIEIYHLNHIVAVMMLQIGYSFADSINNLHFELYTVFRIQLIRFLCNKRSFE